MKFGPERLALLKAEIETNKIPQVFNASSGSNPNVWYLGDLQELGWMNKRYTHDMSGEVDGWERDYWGPNPFYLVTLGGKELELIKKGDTIY